ncbi:MAG: hypothetical protein SCK70_07530 [bacterium]|nr:hypothetical protein [bacterium]
MNRFKILLFSDSQKQSLLDGIEWKGLEHQLLTAQNEQKALELTINSSPQIILVDLDVASLKTLPFFDQLLDKANGSTIIGLTENASMESSYN